MGSSQFVLRNKLLVIGKKLELNLLDIYNMSYDDLNTPRATDSYGGYDTSYHMELFPNEKNDSNEPQIRLLILIYISNSKYLITDTSLIYRIQNGRIHYDISKIKNVIPPKRYDDLEKIITDFGNCGPLAGSYEDMYVEHISFIARIISMYIREYIPQLILQKNKKD